jgi:hypothetical protein
MFKILDCTIRDGGHLNNWSFDKKMVRTGISAFFISAKT